MACLAGTVENPRPWMRYWKDREPERFEGRICNRTNPRTNRNQCSVCPAFRGVRYDTVLATGLDVDDEPYGLSIEEHHEYQRALEAKFIDDASDPLAVFLSRMQLEATKDPLTGRWQVTHGIGARTLAMIGDPSGLAVQAAKSREWRAAHPGADKRVRKRDRAAYMRDYRARQKAGA